MRDLTSICGRAVRGLLGPGAAEGVERQWNRIRAAFLPEPYRTVLPYTMVRMARLRALHALADEVDRLAVPGDIVECGTCNGGSGALLAWATARSASPRQVWLLDSFAGLPPPGPKDSASASGYVGLCHGSQDRVEEVLARVGARRDLVTIVPGWFSDTVPSLPADRIALLHIDADWYDSVYLVLEHLYPRMAPGGVVVFDDYGCWDGCRRACDDYFAARGLPFSPTWIDRDGVYCRAPAPVAAAEAIGPTRAGLA